ERQSSAAGRSTQCYPIDVDGLSAAAPGSGLLTLFFLLHSPQNENALPKFVLCFKGRWVRPFCNSNTENKSIPIQFVNCRNVFYDRTVLDAIDVQCLWGFCRIQPECDKN